MYVTVEELRRFLNIPFCEDDLLLAELEEAAEDVLTGHLNIDSLDVYEGESGELPAALKTAIKTITANFYQNRESIAYAQAYKVPYTLEYMIQPYKNYQK